MNAKPKNSIGGFLSRKSLWFAIICLGVIGGISYATINTRLQDNPLRSQPTYEVQQGPLTISVPVSGTIQARNTVIIKSELEGSSNILFLVPEGTRVKKGDVLVELDATTLIDSRVDQKIKVQNAEAAYINARENFAIVESQGKSDIETARLKYEFAVHDLKKYKEGDYPKLEKEALTKIAEASENLIVQSGKLKWTQILYDQKYASLTELQTDQLSAFRIQNQMDLAKSDLKVLQDFTFTRQIAQYESDVNQNKMALERTRWQANANIVQASAELEAKSAEFEQQKSKLAKVDDQIAKARILAPMDGLVVYATSVRMGRDFRSSNEPLQEGRAVREREELIYLPTTASYKADVKIQESSLEKIRVGLPVRITIDALPGKTYTGKVGTIAPLPNAQNIFMNPDLKVYDSEVYIDGEGDELRSGMSCMADIIVDYFPDTTYVPIHAVLRIADKPTVYVAKGREWEPRQVDLGLDNNRVAQIKSGLKKGEIVWLNPPLASAEMSDRDRIGDASDIPQILKDSKEKQLKDAAAQASEKASSLAQPGGDQQPPRMEGAPQGGGPDSGGQGMGGPGMGGPGMGGPGGGRPGFPNMTPEQMQQMRERFEKMTPEEREQMRQRFQGGPGGGDRQGGMGGGNRQGGGRPDMQNMTPEQREQMRQRFQNMTEEERAAMRRNRGQSRQDGAGQPPQPGDAGQSTQQGGPGQP